ncbi:hypothetical protein B0J17DRAFT_671477 [Rhizoctonia solani]|nr:hypothetical protein B0J17DRAFT_671477 [Rhizoctonia solani]
MATRTYVLSSPPKTTDKTHSRRGSRSGDARMSVTPTRSNPNSDVEMGAASDGWETVTQDSNWGEDESGPSTSTPILASSLDVQHRMLYRGALSVPGSAILLEGIQFIARLPGIVPPLLAAPLPLALESMRGIPALKLLGTMKLTADTARLDTEIDVRLHIHPQAYVTHGYFQRVLILGAEYIPERTLLRSPHPHPHIDPRITSTAVRIGLGEDVIVVYGRLQSEEHTRVERGKGIGKLELVAARLLDPACQSDDSDDDDGMDSQDAMFAVPQTVVRAPRPDDPLPREPPTRAILKRTDSTSLGGIKRTASVVGAKRFGRVRSEVVAKEPTSSVKGKSRAKGKPKAEDGAGDTDDPFAVESEVDASAMLPKMMARVKSGSVTTPAGGEEATNKALVKRFAQSALETYGVDRDDAGFKEIFGYVTRGVGFAFRKKMKCEKIGKDELRKMVVRHVEMYVGGNGEVSVPT